MNTSRFTVTGKTKGQLNAQYTSILYKHACTLYQCLLPRIASLATGKPYVLICLTETENELIL